MYITKEMKTNDRIITILVAHAEVDEHTGSR